MRKIAARLRDEQGMALLLALGMLIVLSISAATLIAFSSSNSRSTGLQNSDGLAYNYAEGALNSALAVLNYWDSGTMTNNASDATLLGCNAAGTSCTPRTIPFDKGHGEFYGTYSATQSKWTITASGFAKNASGAADITKRIVATVPVTWSNTQPANASAWNYIYSTRVPGAGCEVDITTDKVEIEAPLYVTGDLCLSGKDTKIKEKDIGQLDAQPIDVRVGGKVVFSGDHSQIGEESHLVTSAAVQGGCSASINTAGTNCTTSTWAPPPSNNKHYYVETTQTFESITQPTADFDAFYASAKPGPNADCVSAANPSNLAGSVFDSDSTMNGTSPQFDLTGSNSYQCKAYDANGFLVGQLSWDKASHVLTIQGVIFFDGPVTATDDDATYQGSASMYINGPFTMSGDKDQLCAVGNHDCKFDQWNPNTEMLILISNYNGNAINFTGKKIDFQGGLFCNPASTIVFSGDEVDIQGPVICGGFTFAKHAEFKSLPAITELPLGAPVNPNVHALPGSPSYQ